MGWQKFVQYIRMLYFGFIDLNRTVSCLATADEYSSYLRQAKRAGGKLQKKISNRSLSDNSAKTCHKEPKLSEHNVLHNNN